MQRQGNGPYSVEIYVTEGWNIIAGTVPLEGILADSEIRPSDIDAMWYYSPLQNRYIRVHPDPETTPLQQEDDDIVLTSSMWMYSGKSGMMRYSTLEDYPALENRHLSRGYNFVTITPDMFMGSYNPESGNAGEYFAWNLVQGTCTIQRIYMWNYEAQNWMPVEITTQFKGYDFDDVLGNGMVVKVGGSCALASPRVNPATPPGLPG